MTDGLWTDIFVSGLFVGTEVTGTLLEAVKGVTVAVVYMTPPEAVVVGMEVLLLMGYGTLEAEVRLESPLEAPVGYSEEELETELEEDVATDEVELDGMGEEE
ncbi:MAG: hypothetical protein Q9194_006532 [Teloschistes cf. exilis]